MRVDLTPDIPRIRPILSNDNVGRDPEVRDMANGDSVVGFSVAVTRKRTDKGSNEKKEETTWFRVSCFRQLADIAAQYVRKGTQIMVAGRVKARAYLDNNQQPAVSLDLTADTIQLLGGRDEGDAPRASNAQRDGGSFGFDSGDDNIPF